MYNEKNINSIQNFQTTLSEKRSTLYVFYLEEVKKEKEKKKDSGGEQGEKEVNYI